MTPSFELHVDDIVNVLNALWMSVSVLVGDVYGLSHKNPKVLLSLQAGSVPQRTIVNKGAAVVTALFQANDTPWSLEQLKNYQKYASPYTVNGSFCYMFN